jgi:hypothetical protein
MIRSGNSRATDYASDLWTLVYGDFHLVYAAHSRPGSGDLPL